MNGYTLRGTTTGLMIFVTTIFYLFAGFAIAFDLFAWRFVLGEWRSYGETYESLAMAAGRPAVGWVLMMTVLVPLWAISREDKSR